MEPLYAQALDLANERSEFRELLHPVYANRDHEIALGYHMLRSPKVLGFSNVVDVDLPSKPTPNNSSNPYLHDSEDLSASNNDQNKGSKSEDAFQVDLCIEIELKQTMEDLKEILADPQQLSAGEQQKYSSIISNMFLFDITRRFIDIKRNFRQNNSLANVEAQTSRQIIIELMKLFTDSCKKAIVSCVKAANNFNIDDESAKLLLFESRFRMELKKLDTLSATADAINAAKMNAASKKKLTRDNLKMELKHFKYALDHVEPTTSPYFDLIQKHVDDNITSAIAGMKSLDDIGTPQIGIDSQDQNETSSNSRSEDAGLRYLGINEQSVYIKIEDFKRLEKMILSSGNDDSNAIVEGQKRLEEMDGKRIIVKQNEEEIEELKPKHVTIAEDNSLDSAIILDFGRYEDLDAEFNMEPERKDWIEKLFSSVPKSYESYAYEYEPNDAINLTAPPIQEFSLPDTNNEKRQKPETWFTQNWIIPKKAGTNQSDKRLPHCNLQAVTSKLLNPNEKERLEVVEYLLETFNEKLPNDYMVDFLLEQKQLLDRLRELQSLQYQDQQFSDGQDQKLLKPLKKNKGKNVWKIKELDKIQLEEKRGEMISRMLDIKESMGNNVDTDDQFIEIFHDDYVKQVDSIEENLKLVAISLTSDDEFLHNCVEKRLETIWKSFETPFQDQIRMALKYSAKVSTEADRKNTMKALELWDQAFVHIQQREKLLVDIVKFEQEQAKYNSSTLSSLMLDMEAMKKLSREEKDGDNPFGGDLIAEQRLKFVKLLGDVESNLNPILVSLYLHYEDSVRYKGELYREKMIHDLSRALKIVTDKSESI